jgi:hypothetical protein
MTKREQIRPNLYAGTPLRLTVESRPLIGMQELVAFALGAIFGALVAAAVML